MFSGKPALLRLAMCAVLWWCATFGMAGVAWADPTARFVTNFGEFDVALFESQAPLTVANFVERVKQGFYRDTLFHRLVPGVLLQGGAYDAQWRLKPADPPIANEGDNGVSNSKWTLAMSLAPGKHSASSEFFFNLGDNSDFDHGPENVEHYTCVFGEVSEGHDTLRKMFAAGVISGGDFIGDRPAQDIVLHDIILLTDN